MFVLALGLVFVAPVRAELDQPRDKFSLLWVEIHPLGMTAAEAREVESLLLAALSKVPGLEVRDAGRAAQGLDAAPAEVGAELAKAEKLMAEGREQVLNLGLDEAFEAFQSARVIYRKRLAWMPDVDPLIQSLLGLAEVLASQGNDDAARAAYQELLSLSPTYEPDPDTMPTRFLTLFAEARELVKASEKGGVVVETAPPGAKIMLDGLNLGRSPVIKEGVPAGLHSLWVEREGFVTLRRVIEIKEGESYPLDLELVARDLGPDMQALRQMMAGEDGRKLEESARSLAQRAGVAAVILSQAAKLEDGSRVVTLALVPVSPREAVQVLGARWPEEPSRVEAVASSLSWKVMSGLRAGQGTRSPVGMGLRFGPETLLGKLPSKRVAVVTPPRIIKRPEPQVVHRTEPVLPPVGAEPDPVPPPPRRVPIWGRWWFWTGVGVLVAGGVATALALTLGPEQRVETGPDLIRVDLVRDP